MGGDSIHGNGGPLKEISRMGVHYMGVMVVVMVTDKSVRLTLLIIKVIIHSVRDGLICETAETDLKCTRSTDPPKKNFDSDDVVSP